MKYTWKESGNHKVDNLGRQLAKVARNMNQNKYGTRYRYLDAGERFVKHIGETYGLQKLSNIQDKHLASYAKMLQDAGRSDKYIKTEMSALRFLHNEIPQTKYELADGKAFNKGLGLQSTPDGRADRAWTQSEYNAFLSKANELGRHDIAAVLQAVRYTGMRIDEVSTVRVEQLQNAVKLARLHLDNTKGGVPRDIPLNSAALAYLQEKCVGRQSGDYVFTPNEYVEGHRVHAFEKSVMDFIYRHRDQIQDADRNARGWNLAPGERGALTIHGLRHAYARETYSELRNAEGLSQRAARIETAERLGHHRDNVTQIYLAGGK